MIENYVFKNKKNKNEKIVSMRKKGIGTKQFQNRILSVPEYFGN